jgi:hypothetical protein
LQPDGVEIPLNTYCNQKVTICAKVVRPEWLPGLA